MELLYAKIWYFFYFGSLVCVFPFLNLLFRSSGLSDAQIGLLAALRPWVSAPSSFAWSGLADRFRCHRPLLLATFVASSLVRCATPAARSLGAFAALAVVGEFLAAPVGVMADAAVVAACKQDTDYGKSRLWGAVAWGGLSPAAGWLVAHHGMTAAFAAFLAMCVPALVAAWHMELTALGSPQQQQSQQQQQQQQQQHPCQQQQQQQQQSPCKHVELAARAVEEQRLLGGDDQLPPSNASACAGAAPCQGAATAAGANEQQASAPGSAGSPPGGVAIVLPAHRAGGGNAEPQQADQQQRQAEQQQQHADQQQQCQQQQQQQQQPEFCASLRQLLSEPAVRVFLGQAVTMGVGIGVIGEFLFLYLQELGGGEALMGITLTVTCLAEVPVFQLQGALLRHISVGAMLHVVLAAYALRLGLYALLPLAGTPWAVMPIELLHGICFACGWGAGTISCKRLAPPELAATMQGLFQGLYFGLGQGIGGLMGGLLMQLLGSQAMFAAASCIILACWAATSLAEALLVAPEQQSQQPQQQQRQQQPQQQARCIGEAGGQQHEQPHVHAAPGWRQRLRVLRERWFGDAARRGRYAELSSKDSGPDLAAVAAAEGRG